MRPPIWDYSITILSTYGKAEDIVIGVANNTGDRTSGTNKKVNLNLIKADLVKRGKPPYENPTLLADILALDPTVEGDAFLWEEAKVALKGTKEKVQAEKMKYRNRALSVSDKCGIPIAINWTSEGEMVISLGSVEA